MGSHTYTCHPHVYPHVERAILPFTPQLQSITALSTALISHSVQGRRLSWPTNVPKKRRLRGRSRVERLTDLSEACISPVQLRAKHRQADWSRQVRVNVSSVLAIVRHALKQSTKRLLQLPTNKTVSSSSVLSAVHLQVNLGQPVVPMILRSEWYKNCVPAGFSK